MAAHAAPTGGDQKVRRAVAVDVTQADGIEAEGISRRAAGESLDEMAIPAGKQIGASGGDRGPTVLPSADDEILDAVAVDIARGRFAGAEAFTGGRAGERQQTLAGKAGV